MSGLHEATGETTTTERETMSKSNRMPSTDAQPEEPIAGGDLKPLNGPPETKKSRERRSYAADLADLERRRDMAVAFLEAAAELPEGAGDKLTQKALSLLKGQ